MKYTVAKNRIATGYVLFDGPSILDGERIVVILNKISTPSQNIKTGDLMQTFILRPDIHPVEAIQEGADMSICGNCPHRLQADGTHTCYVDVGKSVSAVWRAYRRGSYVDATGGLPDHVKTFIRERKRPVRLGAYGDPGAVPAHVWDEVVTCAAFHTGYTHQWRLLDRRGLASIEHLCMASADTPEDYRDAVALGYRTFRVRAENMPMLEREIMCPASEEAGNRTVCASCKLCGGTSREGAKNIAIIAHGTQGTSYDPDATPAFPLPVLK